MIETRLRDKISANLPMIIKGLQLYDYNMDGKVAREELRKVLENYCFKLTDEQFDKLWRCYDFHHTGFINYKDFFRQLGVQVDKSGLRTPSSSGTRNMKGSVFDGQNHHIINGSKINQEEEMILANSLNYDQIEAEFRSRLRINYQKLKKAFMVSDKHLSGCVSIEDFKSILNNFILPMSDQIFSHLMDRFGIKASGRIAWEIFLEKFQHPVTVGNGQTLPIRPNYRIHPPMETQTVMNVDAVWQHLYKTVHTQFSSLKEAFLQMDNNRDGRVTKKEFRKLIEKFTFRLDDRLFKELMLKIDPYKSNNVDYHTFLRLFEERETKEGHKWLKSVHKYNHSSKLPVMDWKSVEELLQEKITYYWKNVLDWIKFYDRTGSGYLSTSTLKKIIDLQVLPVSDEHFRSLINRCSDFSVGKVNYMEFMERLGVDVSPGDVTGLSTQIIHGSYKTENRRQLDQVQRQHQIMTNQCNRSSHMNADEVITLFKDKMTLFPELRKAFLKNDKQNKGHISQRQFRKILADLGIFMSDNQFLELMSGLCLHNGKMEYMDFVYNFSDTKHKGSSTSGIEHLSNHRVNSIHGDEKGMSAVDAEVKLMQKLRENFSNLKEAFYTYDNHHQGFLDKSSFQHMLDSFMITMSKSEFSKFCASLNITKNTKMNYLEFLERFEQRDLPMGHKWLNSVHRFAETYKLKPFTAPEAHSLLAVKAHRQWNDLSRAFCSMDNKGNGIITRQDLKEILHKFIIPLEPREFTNLWKRLDIENKNYISHQDFLHRLVAPEYGSSDNGPSSQIFAGNYQFLKNQNLKLQAKHEEITRNQANFSMNMPVDLIDRQLRDKIRDNYSDFFTAFRKYDNSKFGVVSMQDIQKVLHEQHIFLNDEQFFALMTRIGLSTSQKCINYSEFLNAFEDGRKSSYGHQARDFKIEKYPSLKPEDAKNLLKMKLNSNFADVQKVLATFDKDGCGQVSLSDFHRVLDMFCFVMTDPQWQHVKESLNISQNQFIDYKEFLSQFLSRGTDSSDWYRYIQPAPIDFTSSTSPVIDECTQRCQKTDLSPVSNYLTEQGPKTDLSPVSNDMTERGQKTDLSPVNNGLMEKDQKPVLLLGMGIDTAERIHAAVVHYYHNIMREFESFDSAKTGYVTAEELREIIAKHIMILTDDQFEKLIAMCSVTEKKQVDYNQFLKIFSEDMPLMPEPAPPPPPILDRAPSQMLSATTTRPSTSRSHRTMSRLRNYSRSSTSLSSLRSSSRMPTPMVNAESAEKMVKDSVLRHWRDIQKRCRNMDTDNSGTISTEQLKDMLGQLGVHLPSSDFDDLATKYDIHENGRFCYIDFIRHFLRAAKPGEVRTLISRERLPNNLFYKQEPTIDEHEERDDIRRRLEDCVRQNWKEMSKEFRKTDHASQGKVPTEEFRRILRKFNINISESEFHLLQDKYDTDFSDDFSYNEFLRDNLH